MWLQGCHTRKIVFKHCDRFIRKKHIPVVSSDAAIDIPSNTLSPDEQANALCGPLYYFQTYAYPLTIAACYGYIDVARLLLEYGADPNATYEYNRHDPNEDFIEIEAPLWFAVEKDDHALAELLIESGAEVWHPFACLVSYHLECGWVYVWKNAEPALSSRSDAEHRRLCAERQHRHGGGIAGETPGKGD